MTALVGNRAVLPSHRLFDLLNNLFVVLDAIATATSYVANNPIPIYQGHHIGAESIQFNIKVKIPVGGPLPAALQQRVVAGFDVGFFPKSPPPPHIANGTMTMGFNRVILSVTGLTFTAFYERHRPWVQQRFGNEVKTWPPLFSFAWAIRNAIAHHEGKLNFQNPTFPGVVWHSLSYTPKDNGREAVGTDLAVADIIILMFEISDELDRLGCPAAL